MQNSIPLIVLSLLCGIGGQLTLKAGMSQIGRIGEDSLGEPLQIALKVLASPYVVGGLALYVLGAAAWLTVLSRVPLSAAYPVLAISYAITPALAWLLLGEAVPATRWFGIITICLGVILVSQS
jgi:drug/metabolite transporter (DMT)-like permease